MKGPISELHLPTVQGPWSWRHFSSQQEAEAFYRRLGPGHPPPQPLERPCQAPDGSVLPAGTWIQMYRPIIWSEG